MADEQEFNRRTADPRLGGAAFMLGHALFLVNKFDEMSLFVLERPLPDLISGEQSLPILLGQLALIVGYVQFFRFYATHAQTSRSGRRALGLLCSGGVLLAIGHVTFMSELLGQLPPSFEEGGEFLFLLVFVGVLLLLIGLIWFGILNLRRPILNPSPWLPLATGIAGLVAFMVFGGEEVSAGHLIFRTIFALGLFGMGWRLWSESAGDSGVEPEPAG